MHERVTNGTNMVDGERLYVRQCSEPESFRKVILEALGLETTSCGRKVGFSPGSICGSFLAQLKTHALPALAAPPLSLSAPTTTSAWPSLFTSPAPETEKPGTPGFDTAVSSSETGMTLREAQQDIEKRFVQEALQACRWNMTKAGKQIGLTRQQAQRIMRRHGIEQPAESG